MMKTAVVCIFAAVIALAYCQPIGDSICAPGEVGLKSHHDCDKFYQCNHGISTVQNCPANLYFNGRECDFRWRVDACVGGIRDPETPISEPEPEPQPEPEPEPQPEPEPEPEPEPQPEPEPEPEPQPEPQPEPNGECPNKPFYYLTNSADSTKFIICQNGNLSGVGKCGEGLVFNQAVQGCLFA